MMSPRKRFISPSHAGDIYYLLCKGTYAYQVYLATE